MRGEPTGPGPPPVSPGGPGRPAGRPLRPVPPLLCNRALGSIKNSALQADCNAPSLGSAVWSGTERGFSVPRQRRPGSGRAGGAGSRRPREQQGHAGLPSSVEHQGQAQGSPGFRSAGRRGLSPELPPARSRSAGCLPLEQKQRKGTLEGSETLHLAPEVALLYLYFFLLLFSF